MNSFGFVAWNNNNSIAGYWLKHQETKTTFFGLRKRNILAVRNIHSMHFILWVGEHV